MRRSVKFSSLAWLDYIHWQKNDTELKEIIDRYLKEIMKDPKTGSGYPQPLAYDLGQVWSRRLDLTHRLIYRINQDQIEIIQCRCTD
ncbi:MAG: Txe/YoeB family addiction module toxin [Reichenbachiella sp.]